MTKEEAANKIISMYSTYTARNGDRYGEMSIAVTLAVAALAEMRVQNAAKSMTS